MNLTVYLKGGHEFNRVPKKEGMRLTVYLKEGIYLAVYLKGG